MLEIVKVRINHLTEYLGVDYDNPFILDWQYSQEKELKQINYSYTVAEKSGRIVFESGIIKSDENFGVIYKGEKLKPCTEYVIRINALTNLGNVSKQLEFETTIDENEWDSCWIQAPLNFSGNSVLVRRDFSLLPKKIVKARAYILGMGYHELYMNGEKITKDYLTPVPSTFDKRLFYRIYDITKTCNEGVMNCVCVNVGKGWFGTPALDAIIKIFYSDGTIQSIHSEDQVRWWIKGSAIIQNSVFDGEVYDARLETKELSTPDYMKKYGKSLYEDGWTFALYRKMNKFVKKVNLPIPPNEIVEKHLPINKKIKESGSVLYEFPRIITGFAKIKVKGTSGSKVIMRFAEALEENGELLTLNLRTAKCTDTYILKGENEEEYMPRFTYRGFRYVEVEIIGNATLLSIEGQYVKTAVDINGNFECSDEDLNKLHENVVYTEGDNQMGILSDCPQRDERIGWLNDLTSRIYQNVNNYDMSAFLKKVFQDIIDGQLEDGSIGDTAPYEIGGYPADPSTVCFLLIPKFIYERYGDISLIKKNYSNCKKWVDKLISIMEDGLLKFVRYGDWCPPFDGAPPDGRKYAGLPSGIPSSFFLLWNLNILCDFAQINGKKADYIKYMDVAETLKSKMNTLFYNSKTFNYGAGTQTENAFAVSLDLLDENAKSRLVQSIKEDVIKRNYHQSGGNQGYRHILENLAKYGENETVYKILKNKEYPGWGYMLSQGAVSIWERWECTIEDRDMQSFCHPMFGSFDEWFYRYLLGIKVIDGVKGMKEFIISPVILKELDYAKGYVSSLNGKIKSSWIKQGDKVIFKFTIPSNSKAKVTLPNNVIEASNGILCNRQDLLSGEYEFICQN